MDELLIVQLIGLVFLLWLAVKLLLDRIEPVENQSNGKRDVSMPPMPPLDNEKLGHLQEVKDAGSIHQYLVFLHEKYGPVVSFSMGEAAPLVVSVCNEYFFA